jgi:hypothetical protein
MNCCTYIQECETPSIHNNLNSKVQTSRLHKMSAYSHNKEDMSLKDNQFVKSEEGKWVLQHRRQWHELICVFLIFIPIGMLVVYVSHLNLNCGFDC